MLLNRIFIPIGLTLDGIRHRLARANSFRLKQIDLPRHGTIWVDETLNFVADDCLRTNLLTKLVLDKAVTGTIFEIISDNLSAIETIPFMLPSCNCEHLATVHEPTCRKIYVRKREMQTPPTESYPRSHGR